MNENLAIEIGNLLPFLYIYFCNENLKVLACLNTVSVSVQPYISEITIGFLFYSDSQTEMFAKEPIKVC